MKRVLVAGLVGVVAIALATAAGAQYFPWKAPPTEKPKTDAPADTNPPATTPDTPTPGATDNPAGTGGPQTPAPGTAAQGSDVKPAAPAAGAPAAGQGAAPAAPAAAEANPAAPEDPAAALAKDPKFMRALKPVVDQIALAVKQVELYNKEMAKPEKDRKPREAAVYELRAAQAYNLAVLKALAAENQFHKAEDKQSIIDLYKKPCREKAVALYLDLADQAEQMNDMRSAISLYQEVLKIDSTNVMARDALKALEETAKAKAPTTNQLNNTGGVRAVPHL